MVDDLRSQIENLRKRVSDSTATASEDAAVLRAFSERLDLHAQTYSDYRHTKLLRHCTIVAESVDDGLLASSLRERSAAESIVSWINSEYSNEETNRDYRSALRVFGKRVAETDDSIETTDAGHPVSLAWVPTGTSSDYDPTPDPRNMLRWEIEAKAMLDETLNARDAAMIALQFDAGLRGGEFNSLSVGDVQDHDHGLQVTVEGKQGRRTILLIPSVPHVNRWLDSHPDRTDSEAPLWTRLGSTDGISDKMVSKAFKEAAKRAEVSNPVTLTNFRKSSAAFLASRNLNQAHIEDHHGWVRGSKAASRYISVFGGDSDRELARLHGVDVSEDEPDPIAPLTCPRCTRETPRDELLCVWCGQAMDPQAASEVETSEGELNESLATLPPEKAEELLNVSNVLSDPEVRNALLGMR